MEKRFLYLYDKIDGICIKYIRSIDTCITYNLRTAGIRTRPTKTNGLWCFTLLPVIMLLYGNLYDVPTVYMLGSLVAIGLSVYCVVFIIFMTVSCLVLTDNQSGGCLPSGIIGCLLVYTYFGQEIDIVLAAAFTVPSTFIFNRLLLKLLSYPKTFTIGEAMVVAQTFVIACVVIVARCTYNFKDDNMEMDLVNIAIATVLSTVGLIVTALYHLNYRNLRNLGYIIGAAAVLELVELHVIIGIDCIPRLFRFIFMENNRLQLIGFWLFLVVVSVVILSIRTRMGLKATTTMRKVFHIMAALVFGSGILIDLSLMQLAGGLGLGVLILVEALRKSQIEPISSALQSAFLVYSDEKDCGAFAMTPLYLYLGLAGPLWLVPREAPALERLAGVLATGIGDTAASWFGSRYGQLKWPGGSRTMEGTLFNILSQIMTVYGLIIFGLLDSKNALLRTAVAATASGLVEARTDQVDNLILPLVTLIAFQTTYSFS